MKRATLKDSWWARVVSPCSWSRSVVVAKASASRAVVAFTNDATGGISELVMISEYVLLLVCQMRLKGLTRCYFLYKNTRKLVLAGGKAQRSFTPVYLD